MKRLRRVAILGTLAVIVAMLAVLAVADPFHLRYARWFTAAFVLVGIVLVTATLAALLRRGTLRWLVLVLGATAAVGWCLLVGYASQLVPDSRTVTEVADGGRRLVVLEGAPISIDPVFAVVVRNGTGPFEQETVVYQGLPEGPAPAGVRFVDGDTVEVQVGGGCLYRSTVERLTLAVDPVHRPLRLTGC